VSTCCFGDLNRRDEGIKWLRASLAEIQGKPVIPIDSDVYDAELEARVREYQRDRRLTVDGLVGYRTQITINTDLRNVEEPRLARAD
jgi:murein L,D-transpeptidase YcbB/YkuD